MDDQDVAALDAVSGVLLPALEMLGPVQVVVADPHLLEVDNTCLANQELQRQIADELAARHKVGRCVQVSADVQRHRDLLAACPFERQVLDPTNRRAGITGERRRVQREILREV